jgi:hypothetical protein
MVLLIIIIIIIIIIIVVDFITYVSCFWRWIVEHIVKLSGLNVAHRLLITGVEA